MNRLIGSVIIVSLGFPLFAETPGSLTLKQCYDAALVQDETLKNQREDVAQSHARGLQALSGALPDISWNWSDTHQDMTGLNSGFGNFIEEEQVESKFTLKQPIFSGFREFSAHAGFKNEQARNRLRLRRAELELFQRVALAFYRVAGLEADSANVETSIGLAQDRVKELRSFFKLGKSRESEVFSAESQAASLRAQKVRLRGMIRAAREDLFHLMGRDGSETPLIDTLETAATTVPLEPLATRADKRSDVEAQRQDMEVQRLRIRYEKGRRSPVLDFTGNYYTHRPSFFDRIDWDAKLNLAVPLYQGGFVNARAREAESQYRQSRLRYEDVSRRAETDVRKAHENWTAAVEEIAVLEEAYNAAKKSHDAQSKEYRLGLVTNLEVIQALNVLQASKKDWDDARFEAKRQYVALLVATETLP